MNNNFDFKGSRAGEKATAKVGRNEPCPCGSGKKFKKYCGTTTPVGTREEEWMYNNDLFGVMDPETGEIAYCCIMGELDEH